MLISQIDAVGLQLPLVPCPLKFLYLSHVSICHIPLTCPVCLLVTIIISQKLSQSMTLLSGDLRAWSGIAGHLLLSSSAVAPNAKVQLAGTPGNPRRRCCALIWHPCTQVSDVVHVSALVVVQRDRTRETCGGGADNPATPRVKLQGRKGVCASNSGRPPAVPAGAGEPNPGFAGCSRSGICRFSRAGLLTFFGTPYDQAMRAYFGP